MDTLDVSVFSWHVCTERMLRILLENTSKYLSIHGLYKMFTAQYNSVLPNTEIYLLIYFECSFIFQAVTMP